MTDRGAGGPGVPEDDATWGEEDERRFAERRARERGTRLRHLRHAVVFTLIVLLVLGTGVAAAGVYQGWWGWPPWGEEQPAPTATTTPCPTPQATAAAVTDVTVAVLNSTDRTGLAAAVAAELTARGFVVAAVANDPAPEPVPGAAVVRHGPEGVLAARTVAAHVDGAELVDDGRAGPAVELSLGEAYAALRPPEAAAALLTPAPVESPAGCIP